MTEKQSLGKTKEFLPNSRLQLFSRLTWIAHNTHRVIEVFESKRSRNEVCQFALRNYEWLPFGKKWEIFGQLFKTVKKKLIFSLLQLYDAAKAANKTVLQTW